MADATGVCYTQSGNAKKYEPAYMSYYLYYRYQNDSATDYLVSYRYKGFFNEYYGIKPVYSIGYPHEIRTQHDYDYQSSPERILLLEDNDTENLEEAKFLITPCNNQIAYSKYDDFLNEYANNIRNDYLYAPLINSGDLNYKHINSNIYHDNSYAFKKYTYGTEEYNEFVSYITDAPLIIDNGNIVDNPLLTIQLSTKGDVRIDNYSTNIRNFADLKFMPDIIIFQNYGILPSKYVSPLSNNSNIYVFGVIGYDRQCKIRYTLPWFEKDINQFHYKMELVQLLSNGTVSIRIYYDNYNFTPYCTYNISDYNTYSNDTYFGKGYIANYGNPITSYFMQAKTINPTFTMFGNMQYNRNLYGFGKYEVTYSAGTIDKSIVSVFDNDSATKRITSIINYSYYHNDNGDEKQDSLFCNTSTANSFVGEEQVFSAYGENITSDALSGKNLTDLAVNIYIPSSSYIYEYEGSTYTLNFCLEDEYCRTFVYDTINYPYKVTDDNIFDIITFDDPNIYIGDYENIGINNRESGAIYIYSKEENDYFPINLGNTINVTKSFTFTVDCTEINMGYKFVNYFDDYNEFIEINTNIDFGKIYKTKETFTVSGKYIKDLDSDIGFLELYFGLFFYPLKGSKYIDIRQNISDSPSIYFYYGYVESV